MFIGHYGIAYVVKRKAGEIPLWLLFLSVQLMDMVAFALVLFGIEKASFQSSDNPFFRNNLDLPYSHSLVGALMLSALMYMILIVLKRKSWALIAALCVLSHWIIDLIVHTPDLSVLFGQIKVGLGLWSYPCLSFVLEVVMVLAGWFFLRYNNGVSYLLLFLLIAGFSGMVFAQEPDIIRSNDAFRSLAVLVPNMLFIVLAYFSEEIQKRRELRLKDR